MLNLTDKIEQTIDLDDTVNSSNRVYKIWLTGLYSRTAEFLLNQLILKAHWLRQITGRNEQKYIFQFIPQAYGLKKRVKNTPEVDCRIKSKNIFADYDFCFRQVTTRDKLGQIVIPLAEDADETKDDIYEIKLREYFNDYFKAFPRKDCPEVTKEDVRDMHKLWRCLFERDENEDYSDLIGTPLNPFEAAQFFEFQKRLINLNKRLLDCTYNDINTGTASVYCNLMEELFEEIDIFYALKEKNDVSV